MASLFFSIRSSSTDEIYQVKATRADANLTISCSCPAGFAKTYCKHRFALISGDITALLSENASDVELLRDMLAGTDVERRLRDLGVAEQALDTAKDNVVKAKRALARAMTD